MLEEVPPSRRGFGEPSAPWSMSMVQVGDPPRPFAFVSIQASFRYNETGSATPLTTSPPPKIIRRFVVGSKLAKWNARGDGAIPAGFNFIHVGVPPKPFAFVSTQTS